jgi:magnesium transporter
MLTYYVRHSAREDFQKVTTPPREDAWVHGEAISEPELRTIADTYDFDLNVLKDVLDKDELPRVEAHDDGLYVFVRMAWRGKHNQIITAPLLLAMKESVFVSATAVTTDGHRLVSPDIVREAKDASGILLGAIASLVASYQELIQHTSRYIHDTGRRLRTHEVTNQDFIQFVTTEDNLNEYKLNLSEMLVVAQRLKDATKSRGDIEAIDDILLHLRQLLVAIDTYNQNITSIRNAYSTIANNTLNQRMKTLTVLTLLVALPNVFYGMYGMNVALPFAEEPWAYGGVLGLTILVVIVVYITARKRGIL